MDSAIKIKDVPPTPPEEFAASHVEHRRASSNGTATTAATSTFAEHGPTIDRSKTRQVFSDKKASNAGLRWPRIRRTFREALSEFMGTFILIMFGDGVVAQVVLSNGKNGDYQSISWGWVCCVFYPGHDLFADQVPGDRCDVGCICEVSVQDISTAMS